MKNVNMTTAYQGRLILHRIDEITEVCTSCTVNSSIKHKQADTHKQGQFSKKKHIFDYFWEKANSTVHVSMGKSSTFKEETSDKLGGCLSPDSVGIPIGYFHVFFAKETHQLAQANQEKNARLRNAFNLGDYVEGSAFDPARKAKEEQARALAMAQKKYQYIEESSESEEETSPPAKRKKKKSRKKHKEYHREHSSSPEQDKKKKKSKKHKHNRTQCSD